MKQKLPIFVATTLLVHQSFSLVAAPSALAATEGSISSKDEVVYANLQANGLVNELYIVNALEVTDEGAVQDYGSYDQVINLTDVSEITQTDSNEIDLQLPTGRFYYQGNLTTQTELPWEFEITYSLDGQEVEPSDLIGEEGAFELDIQVYQNDEVDPAFFENYLLQVSIPLDSNKFTQIEAPTAAVANAGENKQIAFTVMPEEEAHLELSATVTDFELEGIEISALPSSFAIDSPDTEELTGEFDSLTGAISELNDGIGEVKSGVSELANGLQQLETGSSDYQQGVSETASAGSALVSASSSIEEGLLELNEGLQSDDLDMDFDIGLDDELFSALDQFSAGISELAEGITELNAGYQQSYETLKEAMDEIPEHEISEEEIQQLYVNNPESEAVEKLIETYAAASKAKATFDAVDEGFEAVEPALEEMSSSATQVSKGIDEFSTSVQEAINGIDVGEGLDGLNELSNGIEALATQYGSFHDGLTEYTDGVSQLSSGYQELDTGISETADGASELSNGLSELQEGTQELESATSEIPDQLQQEIDEMISQYDKSDFEPISFVSPENNDVIENVQFVIQTESIKTPDDSEQAAEDEEEPSIWQRFLQLFGWD
ncbi:YhgE/Pip domain-containing protein [Alkalicoccobacillus murimartini]|uniref:X-X-X-Leu-X-X-Gly heptad repeat protein n=1 Tax=Alkalicoccobacillus murimartini TaxID=171685 RepID=A0ABT9YHN0_9BACI|nr:YhgE/Pip domain-containing protein [Alkalicoccobacillus murimartini]MDQ0207370.1 X-X-X-Leu-X-X-Gly heptad repeat protein [Alkalicoccobacillus murimartini]